MFFFVGNDNKDKNTLTNPNKWKILLLDEKPQTNKNLYFFYLLHRLYFCYKELSANIFTNHVNRIVISPHLVWW